MTEHTSQPEYPRALCQGELNIADPPIPCFVLEDGTRLVTQRGLQRAIGMSTSGGTSGAHRMARFVARIAQKGIESKDLSVRTESPRIFYPVTGGRTAYGYEATILADLCEFILSARSADFLTPQQQHISDECERLMRGFARIGIVALVDEATGYQDLRPRWELEKILKRYLHDTRGVWAKRFPDEFYMLLFKLRDWHYDEMSVKRPRYVGVLTNDLVYERLAPGVIDKLRELVPRDEHGNLEWRFHQHLTDDVGLPELDKHLHAIIALMKASPNWKAFERLLERAFPKLNATLALPLEFREDSEVLD